MTNPDNLCDLCVFPAVQSAVMRQPWRDLAEGEVIQTCLCCGSWMVRRRLLVDVKALPAKALR